MDPKSPPSEMTAREADLALLEMATRRRRRWRKVRHATYATLIPATTIGVPVFYVWGGFVHGQMFLVDYLLLPLLVVLVLVLFVLLGRGLYTWWRNCYEFFQHEKWR